jgi:hypothetical protein
VRPSLRVLPLLEPAAALDVVLSILVLRLMVQLLEFEAHSIPEASVADFRNV